jgi:hypothetical protein
MFRVLRPAKTAPPRALLGSPGCGADALCPIEGVTFGDRMKDEVETLVAALRQDLVDASDFAR